ncbi:retinitis pigmentosa 1-like 1 protein [Pongo pygmaeus]|uniref:retinitis pigmentosa 1-like 1 protein n=1 Tax=Pongo pygmaeus TaxID=9600 RepID=UPI0023E19669|nr:retinitis pigmentosa 1-like 1 protein [Pongo pygmaeus]
MNSTARDAQAPSHRECLLPSVARTPSVTKVTPAKKITFLKRGDPQFAGVRLAVHQRAFKTFSALMDELSQRVPLSFGVRSVTTPRGLHSLSALEQLEDGGCYLCSDKKPPKTPSGPGRPQERNPTAQHLRDIEGQREAPGTSSSRKSLKTPRRILLIKNTDPRLQQTVVLSHRNTRNLAAFLSKASDLLHFPVKQLYTTSGKKVDSLQALLHSPSVLVCAGHEAFRPPAMKNARRSEAETLSGLTSRNKNGSWGPKTKPSVIHSRSPPGSRPRLPERPGPSNPPAGPAPDRHPQDTPAQPGPLVAGDDMKKKVRMNEDGSLSVEMKVRFHLVGEDTLLWSRRMGRASALTAASGEDPVLGEVDPLCCVWEGYPWGFSEPGVWGPRPCRMGCREAFGRGGQPGPKYEIWTNPLHASQGERVAARKRWGLAQHVRCSGLWGHGTAGRERCSQDSASPASSTGLPEVSEPDSSCCPRTPEDGVDSSSPSAQRGAERKAGGSLGEDPGLCTDGAGLGGPEQGGRLTPRARSEEGASSDLSASTGSHEGSSEWDGRPQGCPGKARAETSQKEATEGGDPGSPALSLSSLRSEDLQAEMQGQGTEQARGASVTKEPLVPGLSGSWDSEGASSTPSTCASSQQGWRKHRSRASAMSSPSSPGLGRVAPRGHPRHSHYCKDTHSPLDSSATKQVPRPPEQRRACQDGSVPRSSGSSSSTRTQASGNLRPPSSGSLPSQDLLGTSSATVTPTGHSDFASGVSLHNAPSAGRAGDAGSRTCLPAPIPPHTSDSCSKSGAASLGEEARDTPQPSSPLVLQVGWPEQGAVGPHQSRCCSQAGTQPAQEAQWGPSPEASWLCGRYCPTPPRGRPCPQRRSSSCGSTSSSHRSAAQGPGGSQQEEGTRQAGPTPSPGPNSGASRRSSASQGAGSGGLSQEKTSRSGGGPQGQEEASGVSPSSLPRSSPEAVVREWLDNIPEEAILMTYEMVDETTGAAGGGLRGPEVDPGDDHSLEGLGEPAQAGQQSLEGDPGQDPEPEGALLGSRDSGPQSGEGVPQGAAPEGVSEAPAEAGADREAPAGCEVSLRALPGRVSASTQIMRALMGSKQGRPSSVPEVSRPVARRLSCSAGALITCLASLQLFDEDLGSPASKVRFKDSPRYQELLSISKDLWPGCDLGEDQLDSGLWELTWSQALPDLGSHAVTENFTPTSSSGVDVSSSSGGSGESSIPCAMDGTLVPQGTELPLKTSNQRPHSRTSENPGDLENQQQCCFPTFLNAGACACATNEDEAERDSEEQRASSNLEQLAENTVQEEVQLEETKEGTEGERLQEGGVQLEETKTEEGLQEEGGVQLEETKGTEGKGQQEEEVQLEETEETGGEGLQEEGAQLEEVKEGPGGGLQGKALEEGLKEEGLPEEGSVHGQELSEASSPDGKGSREDDPVQEEEAGRASASAELCPPEGTEEPTEPPSHLSETDPSASESQSGSQLEPGLEKPPGATVTGQEHTQAQLTQGAAERSSSAACRAALDCDPIWVSVLLKKTKKAFLAHLASAVAELRARWGLQDNDLLDQMVAELQQDVAQRLQDSTKRELQKLQGRAGRMVLEPPRQALTGELLLQTQQRRHRLRGLRNLSAFSERTLGLGPPSFTLEDEPALSTALGSQLGEEAEGEEFCPCEACVRKKVSPTSPKATMGATRGPIKEAFDLQQILQRKRGEHTDGEAAEVAPGKTHTDPTSTRTVQGAEGGLGPGLSQGPGVDEGEDGEESQRLDRDKDPKLGEAEGDAMAQESKGKTHDSETSAGSELGEAEQEGEGISERGETGAQGSGHEDNLQGEAAAGGDQDPGQSDGAEGIEAPKAEGESQPESEGVEAQEAEEESQPESEGVEAQEAEEESQPESEGVEAPEAEGESQPESEGVEAQEAEKEAQEAEEEVQPESEGVEAPEAEGEAQEAEKEAQPETESVEALETEGEDQPESEGAEAQEAEEEAQEAEEEAQEAEGEAQPESEVVEAPEVEGEMQEAEGKAQPESEGVEAPEVEEETQKTEGGAQPESDGVEAQEAEEEVQEAEGEVQEAEGEAQPESEGIEAQPESEGVEVQEAEGEAQPESEGVEAPEVEEETQKTEGGAQPESDGVEAQEAEEEVQEAEGEAQPESEGVEAQEAEEEVQEAEGEAQPESEGVEAPEAEGQAQPESESVEAPEAEGEAQPESEGVEALAAEEEAQPEPEGVEAPEAEGEAQPESEGETQGEKKGSPQVSLGDSQSEEASESISPVPEDRPTPPPSPGGDTPHQRPGSQTGPSSSRASSRGNCWWKDSENDHVRGDTRSPDAKSMGALHAERKATRMYPESSTYEQEEARLGPRTPEQGASEGCDLQEDQALGSLTRTEAVGRADGFGQDDLDF